MDVSVDVDGDVLFVVGLVGYYGEAVLVGLVVEIGVSEGDDVGCVIVEF